MVILFINLLAVGCAVFSAFIPWFGGNNGNAMATTVTLLFGIDSVLSVTEITFNVAFVIFVVTGLLATAGITSLKLFNILAIIIGGAIIGIWSWNVGLFNNFNINRIGFGLVAMVTAIGVSIATLFVFKKKKRD